MYLVCFLFISVQVICYMMAFFSIHDPNNVKPLHTKQASLGNEISAAARDRVETAKAQVDLPSKPLSVQEENRKKGYFPISWRVIGGGVPLGGKRICILFAILSLLH